MMAGLVRGIVRLPLPHACASTHRVSSSRRATVERGIAHGIQQRGMAHGGIIHGVQQGGMARGVQERSIAHGGVTLQQRGMAHGRGWMEKKGKLGFKKARNVDVVLLADIAGLGVQGQVVSLTKGYAMNSVVRSGKGEIATPLNRYLYAKDSSELGTVDVSALSLMGHLSRWAKRIENTEILITRYRPNTKGMEVIPFEIIERLNQRLKTNLPPFCLQTIQPILQDEDQITIFSRRSFETQLQDFDALNMGEALDSLKIKQPGKYVVTLDLAKGLNLPKPILGRLRVQILAQREVSEMSEGKERPKKVRRTPNPRRARYRHAMGMEGAKWDGWENYKIEG